jgi:hypothetical protein
MFRTTFREAASGCEEQIALSHSSMSNRAGAGSGVGSGKSTTATELVAGNYCEDRESYASLQHE